MTDQAPADDYSYPDHWQPPHLRRAAEERRRIEAEARERAKAEAQATARPNQSPLLQANSFSPNGFHMKGI